MNNDYQISIQFLGAAGSVTGSKYLITTPHKKIMVDCGLFQGLKQLRERNWNPLPLDVSTIDIILLTHGHLDHTGYLPRIVKDGFTGEIWCNTPTFEITKIIMQDSAKIQEEDAKRANEEGFSKHHPALPLYNLNDVENTLPYFVQKPLDVWIEIAHNISCRFQYNGHIIGATFIELKIDNEIIVFSGDIGREEDVLLYAPKKPTNANVILMESTYGNRIHKEDAEQKLIDIIKHTSETNGTVIIPSFAVERTQALMYMLWKLRERGAIPNIPVYMDSPMGTKALKVFEKNLDWHKLLLNECQEMSKEIKLIETIQETYQLAKSGHAKIIIAGSGMASGGRVLTYFVQYLGNANATILLVGYQAEGTRGRDLLEGAKEIKLFGKYFPVRASVEKLDGLSSHADQNGLINWLSDLKTKPRAIYLIHGESEGALGLQSKIKEVYGWEALIPELNEKVMVDSSE